MKGKYAARATLRREDSLVRSEIDSYQHNVRKLIQERDLLREQVRQVQAVHKAEVRKLRAQIDEGLSPELLALRKELERQRERADEAVADKQRIHRTWDHIFRGLRRLLVEGLGLTPVEALEVIVSVDGLSPGTTDPDHPPALADDRFMTPNPHLTRGQVIAIGASKGTRNRGDVVKLLRSRMRDVKEEVPYEDCSPQSRQ